MSAKRKNRTKKKDLCYSCGKKRDGLRCAIVKDFVAVHACADYFPANRGGLTPATPAGAKEGV